MRSVNGLLIHLWGVAALCALFFHFFGPLADHHFTERQLGHTHVYLGKVVPDHAHPYQVPHAHGEVKDTSEGLHFTESGGGIIFLPPDEEGATGSRGLNVTAALLTMFIALVIPPMLTQTFPLSQRPYRSIIPPPEPPPPRPAL